MRPVIAKSTTPSRNWEWGSRGWTPPQRRIIEDYETNNTFQHAKSGFHYKMLRKNGKFIQQRFLLDRNQQPIDVHEEEVTYVVGSGNHARSYLRHHPNGVITQLPVTWYSQQKRWDMSPGYDVKDHLDFIARFLKVVSSATPHTREWTPSKSTTALLCQSDTGRHWMRALPRTPAPSTSAWLYKEKLARH